MISWSTEKLRRSMIYTFNKLCNGLREYGIYAKLDKRSFDQHQVDFMGYTVSSCGMLWIMEQVQTILDSQTPKYVRDVQCFLGFTNFYWKFIKDYLKIVLPLTQLTQKNQPFVWCRNANTTFEGLKHICANYDACWSNEALYTWSWCIQLCTRKCIVTYWRQWLIVVSGFSLIKIWSCRSRVRDSWQRASCHCGFFSRWRHFSLAG